MKNVLRCRLTFEIPVDPKEVSSITAASAKFSEITEAAKNAGNVTRSDADFVRVLNDRTGDGQVVDPADMPQAAQAAGD